MIATSMAAGTVIARRDVQPCRCMAEQQREAEQESR